MSKNQNINVSWQATLFIFALLVAAGAVAVRLQDPGRQLNDFFDDIIFVALPVGVLAFICGLYAPRNRDRKTEVLARAAIGIGLLVVAGGVTAVSYCFGTFSAFGSLFFLVPSGLYVAGIVAIVKALSPSTDRTKQPFGR